MKKIKKILLIIAVIAALILFFVIDTIKGIQSKKNLTDSERYIESLIPQETYTFEKILAKADFGKFLSADLTVGDIKSSPFYDTILKEGFYSYYDEDFVQRIFEVLENYDYVYTLKNVNSDKRTRLLCGLEFRTDNINHLMLNINTTAEKDTLCINFMFKSDIFGLKNEWFDNHSFGFLADEELCEELCDILLEHTKQVSLEEVEKIINENTEEMKLADMFQYENVYKENYVNRTEKDNYFVYEQRLMGSEEYLLTYVVDEQVVGSEETGEENKHCCYIFKIELFEKNGTLKKVLYDDTERYNRDMKGIEQ